MSVEKEIKKLEGEIGEIVKERLAEFAKLGKKGDLKELFSELCFCILTANSTAERGIKIQNELGFEGFYYLREEELKQKLKEIGHRFYNMRAKFIVEARGKIDLLKDIYYKDSRVAREMLVKEFKGIGYKEASHFLRNIGKFDVAILDRHILKILKEEKIIEEVPKTLTRKRYLEIEDKFLELARKLGMLPGELDLYLWYKATGKVLK